MPIILSLTLVLLDFSLTVKAAPHECVMRTGQPWTLVKAENEAWFYSKVTVSSCAITSVKTQTYYYSIKRQQYNFI